MDSTGRAIATGFDEGKKLKGGWVARVKGSVKTNTNTNIDQHRMSKTVSASDVCKEKIIQQIKKQIRKGCIEGVLISPCEKCDDYSALTNKIYLSTARITVNSSSVSWKSYGYSDIKERK